jgi:hypothetical protein
MADVMNVGAIEKMSREDFFTKIVRGFAGWEIFSRLVCLGPDSLEEFEKNHLREEMTHAGIASDAIKTDTDLHDMARKISARAVNVR